jgi:hypothetical protein
MKATERRPKHQLLLEFRRNPSWVNSHLVATACFRLGIKRPVKDWSIGNNFAKLVLALVWVLGSLSPKTFAQQLPGIPEPGLILYGSVSNINEGLAVPLVSGSVTWTVSHNGSSAVISGTIIGVNGQFFYIARLPFETRHIGLITFTATSNTLELVNGGATYSRSASVNGSNAIIASSSLGTSNFVFSGTDRGRTERVDLQVNLPPETFAQWALRIFGTTNIDPNADPLHKGMTYYQQYIAGTDPLDLNSVFKLISILPSQPPGIVVQWDSVAGKSYNVQRSTIVATNYIPMATNLLATGTLSSFQDTTANGFGPYFYRVQVNPP